MNVIMTTNPMAMSQSSIALNAFAKAVNITTVMIVVTILINMGAQNAL